MRVLITGASGKLGMYLIEEALNAGHELIAWTGRTTGQVCGVDFTPVELTNPLVLHRALESIHPDAIVHTAAVTSAQVVRDDPFSAHALNVTVTAQLAVWCRDHERRLIFTSTDLVFDGHRGMYREHDPAEPIVAYGQSKRSAEVAAGAAPRAIVARLSLLYGPARGAHAGFYDQALADLIGGRPRRFFSDEYRTPLSYAAAASYLVALLSNEARGTLHVGGPVRMSRLELMSRVAATHGIDPALVQPSRLSDAHGDEPRPADVSLDTSKLRTVLTGLQAPDPLLGLAETT